jgi:hypothetical protein
VYGVDFCSSKSSERECDLRLAPCDIGLKMQARAVTRSVSTTDWLVRGHVMLAKEHT